MRCWDPYIRDPHPHIFGELGELGTPYNDIYFDIASTCRWSEVWICSARFVNLRNFEIAYRSSDFKIATLFRNWAAQFRNCVTSIRMRTFKTVHVLVTFVDSGIRNSFLTDFALSSSKTGMTKLVRLLLFQE